MGDLVSLANKIGALRIAQHAMDTSYIRHIEQAIEDGKTVTFIDDGLYHMHTMKEVDHFLDNVEPPVSYVVTDSSDAFGWLVYI